MRWGLVAIAASFAVAASGGQAEARLPSAPDALPQLWGLHVDGRTLRTLDRPTLAKLRAARVALVAAGRPETAQRVHRLARRAGLVAFHPLATADPAGTCARVAARRPAARCGVAAPSPGHARVIARAGVADLVLARTGRRTLRTLAKGARARVLGVVPLTNRGFRRGGWRRVVRMAAGRKALDLVVRPEGARSKRAIDRFLAVLARNAPRDRKPPPKPGKLGVKPGNASSVVLTWRRPEARDLAGYGVYREGRRIGSSSRPSAAVGIMRCSGQRLAIDAVDRHGNRSPKRVRMVRAGGCDHDRVRSQPDPGADGWSPTLAPGYDVPATRFVAPSGSDGGACTAQAPCASFGRAFAVAAPGEIVDVAAGTYGSQIVHAVPGREGPSVIFRAAQGARVVLDGLSVDGADHVTFGRMETTHRAAEPGAGNQEGVSVGPGSTYVVLEDLDAGSLDTWFADHVFVAGGDFGPCHAVWGADNVCGNSKLDVSTNVTVDGATFHDYRFDESCFTGGADCHWECLYVNGSRNTTIRNSRFHGCAIFDIFTTVSGADAATMGHENLTIENNFFAAPWTESASGGSPARPTAVSLAWCQNAPSGYRNVRVRFNSFQRNTTLQLDQNPSCVFDNIQVVGNLMMWDGCQPRWTFAYNGWSTAVRTGTCAATDRVVGSLLPYIDPGTGTSMDYHLAAASPADDLVPLSVGCPATDIDGQRRGASGSCDAGADER